MNIGSQTFKNETVGVLQLKINSPNHDFKPTENLIFGKKPISEI